MGLHDAKKYWQYKFEDSTDRNAVVSICDLEKLQFKVSDQISNREK